MLLTVAFDYGTRVELLDAVDRLRAAGTPVTPASIDRQLYLPELPPVDVLVRTSGEGRVSNFLLWQSAGAPVYFTDEELARVRRRRARRGAGPGVVTEPAAHACRWRRVTVGAARRRGAARSAAHGRRSSRRRSTAAATSSCRPAPAPARRSPTSCRRSRRAAGSSSPRPPRRCRTSSPARISRSSPRRWRPTSTWAVLKGRSNYVCLQRVREVTGTGRRRPGRLELDELAPASEADVGRIAEWVGETPTGDVAELDFAPTRRRAAGGSPSAATSVPAPTAARWASRASPSWPDDRAAVADVVVVNTYLYGLDVGAGGAILPEHDVVVFDEAHGLEDIMSTTLGVQIGPGRFVTLGGVVRRILDDPEIVGGVVDVADVAPRRPRRRTSASVCRPLPRRAPRRRSLDARGRLERALAALDRHRHDGRRRQAEEARAPR